MLILFVVEWQAYTHPANTNVLTEGNRRDPNSLIHTMEKQLLQVL